MTITELPGSPETGVASVARARGGGGGEVAADVSAAEEGDHARAPGGGGASPLAGGGAAGARGAGRVPVGGGEARFRRSGRAHAGVVADHERGFAFPAARAGRDSKRARDEKKPIAGRFDPTRRVVAVTERATVTTRRYGPAAGVTNASDARQRMIAERTRRILDDE